MLIVAFREKLVMLTPAECARSCWDLGLVVGRVTSGGQTVDYSECDTLDTLQSPGTREREKEKLFKYN